MNPATNNTSPHRIFAFNQAIWLCLAGFALRIFQLAQQSFWGDELITVGRTLLPVNELMANLFEVRNHVPLYFLLLQPWGKVGISEFVLRFFSVIWSVMTIALAYRLGKLAKNHRTGILTAVLLTISPLHIWFSQEVRMYSLLPFLVLLANYLLWLAITRHAKRYWVGYTAVTLLALLTHFFAVLILIAHYVFFSLNYRRLKPQFARWFLATAVASLPFAGWMLAIFTSGGFENAPIGWIPPAHWYEPALTWLALAVGPTIDPRQLWFALPAILFALGVLGNWIHQEPAPDPIDNLFRRFLLMWLLIPILLVWLISLDLPLEQKRSIYVDRYFVMTLPALALLVALGWQAWQARWQRPLLIPIALTLTLAITAASLANLYFHPDYARENWRSAITQLEAAWQPGDLLLLTENSIMPYLYYRQEEINSHTLTPIPGNITDQTGQQVTALLTDTKEPVERVWLLIGFSNINPHGFPQARNLEAANPAGNDRYKQWLDGRYPILSEWQAAGVHLTLYHYQP